MLSGLQNVSLLITQPHACSYLEQRTARNLVVDPRLRLDAARYEQLLEQGFRRSGDAVYRPHCPQCQACTPVRIPVRDFAPDRAQRRCMKR
ncbi:MAG: arginyltransferase, partial [Algiphilus sp.]